ncbi:MAG: tandem-95 repeat protein [Mycolicibacterium cosmeticum]|nr:tandem-95 repeat protein [Mycolicibacterium cosmeticum]
MQTRYGKYIGRVGALAVALGVGSAIAGPAGIAWATTEDSTSSPTDTGTPAGNTPPAGAGETTGTTKPGEPTGAVTPGDVTPADGTTESSGTRTSGDDTTDKPKPKSKKKPTTTSHTRAAESAKAASRSAVQSSSGSSAPEKSEDETPTTAKAAAVTQAITQQSVTQAPVAFAAARPVVSNPVATVGSTIGGVVQQAVSSFLGALRGALTNSPLGWVMLGAARREVGTTEDASTEIAARAMAATQAVAAANQPPTATVAWGRPDATTGTVVGKLSTADAEGKAVSVKLTGTPATGTLTYNATTTTFTYTPTTAQRFNASATPSDDTVAMTLTLSDGVNTVAAPVNIPVSPSPFYSAAALTNITDPSAVVASGARAYVTDRSTGRVTVFDTTTNAVVTTFAAGTAPDGLAVKADGTRLYVSSSTGNTVTVIDTATNVVKATVAVTNPGAITINPVGDTVYVANTAAGTVTKISTSTNKVVGTVTLAAGLKPTGLAVSADGKTIFVTSTKTAGGGNISAFSSTASTATTRADVGGTPVGLVVDSVYKKVYVADTNGGLTVIDLVTGTAGTLNLDHPLSGIALTKDRSALMVVTSTGLVAALRTNDGGVVGVADLEVGATSPQSAVALTADGTRLWVTDARNGTVRVMSLVPENKAPFSNDPVATISNPLTGALAGRVGVVDFDGDPLTYVVTAKPTKGTLVLKADGTYTYTPTAAARHAAAVPGAPASVTTDSFTVTVSDGRYGTVTSTLSLAIDPANKVPTVTTTIGSPNTTTGVVKGTVAAADGDSDKRTYQVTGQPLKGTVGVTTAGAFTYTPSSQARAAALAPGATHDQKMDTFTVTVDDGHGGVVPVTVNVKIGAANVKPAAAKAVVTVVNPRSGITTGTVTATDSDGDTLTYTPSKTTKGALVVNGDGSFTYTPTAAARLAASKAGATAATKSETVTFTVSDGFGGTTTTSVVLSIAKNPVTNTAPQNAAGTVDTTSTAIGTVTGTVTAVDPDGDALTYSLGTGPAFGAVKVTTDGKFTYTPDVDARYRALVTPGTDTDTFTVNATDAFGGITTATVEVTIAPPSASAVDQRPTQIAVNAQQMYFYSQTDTDKAMGLLKDAGITTIRIMLPWAGIEPDDDSYDWDAVDRVVDSAQLKGITVLGVLGTTPDWAAVPGQVQYQGRPADLNAFDDFVTEVATHFQGRVSDYEVWNEPNANFFWAPVPDAAQYTALLKVAYAAIKEADPDAVVIAASVGAGAEDPGVAINPVTFLAQMYAAGAGGYFDAVSFHPYQYGLLFSVGEGHAGTPVTQAEQMYALMLANGDGNKKIWATEYGVPTSVVSEAAQAAYIGDFLRTWRTLDFAGPAFLHTFADYPDADPIQATFGLFRQDWTPKPAVATVEQVLAENAAIEAAADASVL